MPDLDALDPNELKALIVSQHELIVSRDGGIEQLKLLIANLRRMQCLLPCVSDRTTAGEPSTFM